MADINKIGTKIARIRKFRGMTQAELGVALGLNPTNASIRVSQYESNKKIPKDDMIIKIAEALDIHPCQLNEELAGECFPIVQMFWFEEATHFVGELFPFLLEPSDENNQNDEEIDYEHDDEQFNKAEEFYGTVGKKRANALWGLEYHDEQNSYFNKYVLEYMDKKRAYFHKEIDKKEYFDWKIRWPNSSKYSDQLNPLS